MYAVERAPTDRTGFLVALAEDDQDIRWMLKEALLAGGYDVLELPDGLALMTLLSAAMTDELPPPDFIVADIRMPHATGLEALQALQRTALTTPVVLMTAFMDNETRAQADMWGAAAVLEKPFAPDQLLATLSSTELPAPA
ncbi:MAG: response regulator [Myxococcales bacterium]|nr:response regulator [Myxococcales bacterium]